MLHDFYMSSFSVIIRWIQSIYSKTKIIPDKIYPNMVPASLKELRTSVNLSQPRKATLMDCKQVEIILL